VSSAPAETETAVEVETPEERANARYHVLFDARESVRYHDRRVAHFELLQRLTNLLTILLAGIVAMELLGAKEEAPPVHWFTRTVAGFGALMSAFDLLVGFARSADLHRSLKRRFIELEKKCSGEFDAKQITRERLTIEADEPPIYRALQLRCTRELAIAEGIEPAAYPAGYVTLPWYMRLTANWLHWPDAANLISRQERKGFWRWPWRWRS
jgi:hypothetical protein